ncbi:MAG: hypothetical protein LUI60_08085 [Clostridia bacterium]|nr:hypothetical protein [Clostridia bacterium]
MKYIRRAIVIILAAVFIAAAAIGVSVVFAVRNINVATVSYSSAAVGSENFSASVETAKTELSSLSGKNLLGVTSSDISSLVPSDGYARFVSAEKVYPCTVNVTLEERLETFAVLSEDGKYLVYDEQGAYITAKVENINNLDGCPNVIVSAEGSLEEIAAVAGYFGEEFSALRSVVESITVTTYAAQDSTVLAFRLYCGITLRLVDYAVYPQEKVKALHTAFQSLDDYAKTGGELSCHSDSSGQLYITLPGGSIYKV